MTTETPAWRALLDHVGVARAFDMRELFALDPARFERLSLQHGDILLDYSKHLVTDQTLELLFALAHEQELPAWIARMFAGERINNTEDRPALHTALRARAPVMLDGRDITQDVVRVRAQMRRFCDAVRSGRLTGSTGKRITDVISIGIGGSDLGPVLAVQALTPYTAGGPQLHFMSNVDGAHVAATIAGLDPEATLVIVVSKTFTTQETLANANTVRAWLNEKLGDRTSGHFVAVTSNAAAARAYGVDDSRIFEFWDWVGGRYSVWSAVGLGVALAIGMENFEAFCNGAAAMDAHFRDAPLARNMPVIMGVLGVWYIDFFGAATHAVLPYDQRLERLPDYLQQLEMESCGKQVTRDGKNVAYATAPVVWGAPGTNGQHAFHQLLHQGTQIVPADFIACCRPHHVHDHHHRLLLSNFLAQTEALMRGRTADEARADMQAQGLDAQRIDALLPHRVFPGNRPTSSLLLTMLTPAALGQLVALYEHKVFVQSVIWNINAFDQWGVELGKTLADRILPELQHDGTGAHDASTLGLIAFVKSCRD